MLSCVKHSPPKIILVGNMEIAGACSHVAFIDVVLQSSLLTSVILIYIAFTYRKS